jgi:hypothetical protein
LIYSHSEVELRDKPFCSSWWVWESIRAVENIIVKWVLKILRNDPPVLSIELVVSKSETVVTVDVVQIHCWDKDLVVTDGNVFECDEVNL